MNLINANSLTIPLKSKSIHAIITSPPYWGLRDYGVDGQLGAEPLHDCLGWATGEACGKCYVCHITAVTGEIWRVLRDDGVFWLNLGDCYKNKSKALIPYRVALALESQGWYVRSDVIWEKSNALPESVNDRVTNSHEYVFMLTKSERYFFDRYAILEPYESIKNGLSATFQRDGSKRNQIIPGQSMGTHRPDREDNVYGHGGRNKRSVWTTAVAQYAGSHFAVFPPELVEPMVLSSVSRFGVCGVCKTPYRRIVSKEATPIQSNPVLPYEANKNGHGKTTLHQINEYKSKGWEKGCDCETDEVKRPIILDPFCGSGTVGEVCTKYQIDFIGLDLNFDYLQQEATPRLTKPIQISLL